MTLASLLPLANHLWQSTLFVVVVWLLTLALQKNRAAARYWLWLAASVKFLIPFSLLVSAGTRLASRPYPAIANSQFSSVMEGIAQPFANSVPTFAPSVAPAPHLIPLCLFSLWLSGFGVCALSFLRHWLHARAAVRAAAPLHLDIPIAAMSSASRTEPGIFGIRRPVLLMPQGLIDRLTHAELKAILAHEMCHVRRCDNLTAAIHLVVEAIFWFHPFAWYIGSRLLEERESACDEEVMRALNDPPVYAEAILKVCTYCIALPSLCTAGVTGANLKKRIEAIMATHMGNHLSVGQQSFGALIALGTILLPIGVGITGASRVHAQQSGTAAALSFEVASVKVNQSGTNQVLFEISPGGQSLVVRNLPVSSLTMKAYGIYQIQLTGSPLALSLMRDPAERYDIDAKAGHPVSRSEMMQMLRTLLADRFKLSLHREKKEVAGYALLANTGGPKLREHVGDDNECKVRRNGDGSVGFQNCPMESLAANLLYGAVDSHFVENQTGLKGSYDFEILFSQEMPANPREGRPEARVINPDAPSIFTALKQQLGLRLQPRKITIEMFNVDHVEKPSEN